MKEFMSYDFNVNKLVVACYVAPGTGTVNFRDRTSHGLALHLSGNKTYVFSDGRQLDVTKGSVIYLPKHSNYHVVTKGSGDCYAINFDVPAELSFNPFVTKTKNFNVMQEYFRSATKVWNYKQHSYTTKCKAELYNVIYQLQQEYFSDYFPQNKLGIIKPAIEYIHKNYTGENISVELLSGMCNITPEYFRKIFKSFYGESPLKYINNLKIAMAKDLIISSMHSISEVARLSGFRDEAYFSRKFKKATGINPSEFSK